MTNKFLIFMVSFLMSYSALANTRIMQKPILFNHERIELTREYRKLHYGIDSKSIEIVPQMIVLHWTGSNSFQSAFNTFYPVILSEQRTQIAPGGRLNISAQFLVDRDGTIYQLMPSNWMARHVIGLNNVAIGIENVGGEKDQPNLTPAQVNADVFLVNDLVKQYPTIQYLIGHYEYTQFQNSPLWNEKLPNYLTNKKDPGADFMREVRKQVANLHLKGPPQ